MTLQEDLIIRQRRVQEAIRNAGYDACILATAPNIYYLTGIVYSGFLYLPVQGEAVHFVRRPVNVGLERAVYIRKPEQIADELLVRPANVMLETDVLSYTTCRRLLAGLGLAEAGDASTMLRRVRSIKTPFEIAQIRHNAQIHKAFHEAIPSLFCTGMTDLEFQIELERKMRQLGSIGYFYAYGENMAIFMGSVLTGDNAQTPSPYDFALGGAGATPLLPIGASGEPILPGRIIMVDMAGNYTPLLTDVSRVYACGEAPDIARKAHSVSIEICNAMLASAKSGTACAELWEQAMSIVRREKLEQYFMGTKQQARFVGHGVGLEINEPPVMTPKSKEVLEVGTVFAYEPKFVIPGIGAAGIENTYLVTDSGIEKLTDIEENIIQLA
ncbi:MAG: Xaa-Pro peptidase family protein [Bacteroidales bacterium]|jgi:Xaa-Pro aminopeptidase|nr:Xaa-Pro peptidase family protein [Bacteroidales bacterium]